MEKSLFVVIKSKNVEEDSGLLLRFCCLFIHGPDDANVAPQRSETSAPPPSAASLPFLGFTSLLFPSFTSLPLPQIMLILRSHPRPAG